MSDMSDAVDHDSKKRPTPAKSLLIVAAADAPLSPAQVEFNRLMKRLNNARAKHAKQQAELDQSLATCIEVLMPMVEELARLNCEIALITWQAMENTKFSAKRRDALVDLIGCKVSDLLEDPTGLSAEKIERLEWVLDQLSPSDQDRKPTEAEELELMMMRAMLEQAAQMAGVDLDLSDLDMAGDPAEVERILKERMGPVFEAVEGKNHIPFGQRLDSSGKPRKPTKAQIEKERKRLEQEEVKNRDIKSLYKQLAKVLHPDLETDPVLKVHKEEWMKRLTAAYQNGDLHDMLLLEMEWLGEESSNLIAAGEEKLRIYCQVLKEQVAQMKDQTEGLFYEPRYETVRRFKDPIFSLGGSIEMANHDLLSQLKYHRGMLEDLVADDAESQKMIQHWADNHMMIRRR
jgi:hypothetical protein